MCIPESNGVVMDGTPPLQSRGLSPDAELISLARASFVTDLLQVNLLCQERNILIGPTDVADVLSLMTPQEVLNQQVHERTIITPSEYPTFEALKLHRNFIRDLKLVPKRDNGTQQEYERLERDAFIALVRGHYLRESDLTLVRELYQSELPDDMIQSVAWLDEHRVDSPQTAAFIAKLLRLSGKTTDDIILFERSRTSTTDFVRAAVPEYRHIHIWSRKKEGTTFL